MTLWEYITASYSKEIDSHSIVHNDTSHLNIVNKVLQKKMLLTFSSSLYAISATVVISVCRYNGVSAMDLLSVLFELLFGSLPE